MKRNVSLYLRDIYDNILRIEAFIQGMAFETFKSDEKTSFAVIHCLEIIGEAAKNIPDNIRDLYSQIPWRDIMTMRNKIAHEYFGVDLEIVWLVIQDDLPAIKPLVEEMMADPSVMFS